MAKEDNAASTLSSLLVARGVVAILFGILALAWPGLTLATLSLFIMLWLVITGVVMIVQSIMNLNQGWSAIAMLLLGVLQIGVGAYLVQRPELAVTTLVSLVALVLIIEGVITVVASLMDEASATTKTIWVIAGVLYVIAGVAVWQYPITGSLAFVWVLGLAAVVNGTLSLAAAHDIKKLA